MAINANCKIQQALTMTAKTQQQRRADVLAKYEASGCKSILAHYNQLKREAGGEFMSYNGFVGIINRARDDRYKERRLYVAKVICGDLHKAQRVKNEN